MCFRGGDNEIEIIFRLVEFVFRKRAVLNVNMLLFKTRMHEIFFWIAELIVPLCLELF